MGSHKLIGDDILSKYVGKTFGRLTIIRVTRENAEGHVGEAMAVCKCSCGAECRASLYKTRMGWTKSCGCAQKESGLKNGIKGRACMGEMDGTRASQLHINDGVRYRRNVSGRMGVYWDEGRSKWGAALNICGGKIFLGRFTEFEAACEARRKAEIRYFSDYVEKYQEQKNNRGDKGNK